MALSMKARARGPISLVKPSKKVPSKRKDGKVWVMAVDPFSELDIAPVWNMVYQLSEKFGAQVKVAYVLSPAGLNWTGDFSGPWFKKFEPLAESKLNTYFPQEDVEKIVLKCESSGQRAAVETLLKFAKKQKAECVALCTHGRKGIERIAMGSFAETMIQVSPAEVLTFNPSKKTPSQVKKILVPTDLSKASEKYVLGMGEFAKSIGAEVVIYHKQPDPLDPIIQQGVYSLGGGWVSVQSYFEEEMQDKMKQIRRIEERLTSKGVKTSHIMDTSSDNLIGSIHRAVGETNSDMVSVLTHAGPWSAQLLGSVARGLVRESKVPVLVRR